MLTSRKTSHGPQKSMMTAPSEITKANRDLSLGWRLERICFDRGFVIAGTARGFDRSCVCGKLTDNEESKRSDQTGSRRGID